MSNDLSRSLFPANEVKLLVVDEAHRAQGDYAYCQVQIQFGFTNVQGPILLRFLHLVTNLQTRPKVRQHALIKQIFGQNVRIQDTTPKSFHGVPFLLEAQSATSALYFTILQFYKVL